MTGMDKVRVHPIPPELLGDIWPVAKAMLAPAVARAAPLWDIEDMPQAIAARVFDLWLVTVDGRARAAALARVTDYPRVKALDVPFVGGAKGGGTGLRTWIGPLHDALAEWGRANGATFMTGGGRKGWCRVLGFREWNPCLLKEI